MATDTSGDKLRVTVKSFFTNNPLQENKKLMWELYTSWVYQDEIGDSKEHYDLLFFYERLIEFMDELYETTKSNDEN
jgi:hypothetical protein